MQSIYFDNFDISPYNFWIGKNKCFFLRVRNKWQFSTNKKFVMRNMHFNFTAVYLWPHLALSQLLDTFLHEPTGLTHPIPELIQPLGKHKVLSLLARGVWETPSAVSVVPQQLFRTIFQGQADELGRWSQTVTWVTSQIDPPALTDHYITELKTTTIKQPILPLSSRAAVAGSQIFPIQWWWPCGSFQNPSSSPEELGI